MDPYEGLAKVYDRLMVGVDYDAWADYILEVSASFGLRPKTALDLACGTGNTSIPLAKQGLKVTGVDMSRPMLAIAEEKAAHEGLSVNFMQRNMLKMSFHMPFDLVVSYQDGLNYLAGDGEFDILAGKVKEALKPGGLFIFDLNQVDKYEGLSDGDTEIIDEDDLFMVYEYDYRGDDKVWQIRVTGFIKQGALYERFNEFHEEKHHNLEDVKKSLEQGGFNLRAIWGIFSKEPPAEGCRRLLLVAEAL